MRCCLLINDSSGLRDDQFTPRKNAEEKAGYSPEHDVEILLDMDNDATYDLPLAGNMWTDLQTNHASPEDFLAVVRGSLARRLGCNNQDIFLYPFDHLVRLQMSQPKSYKTLTTMVAKLLQAVCSNSEPPATRWFHTAEEGSRSLSWLNNCLDFLLFSDSESTKDVDEAVKTFFSSAKWRPDILEFIAYYTSTRSNTTHGSEHDTELKTSLLSRIQRGVALSNDTGVLSELLWRLFPAQPGTSAAPLPIPFNPADRDLFPSIPQNMLAVVLQLLIQRFQLAAKDIMPPNWSSGDRKLLQRIIKICDSQGIDEGPVVFMVQSLLLSPYAQNTVLIYETTFSDPLSASSQSAFTQEVSADSARAKLQKYITLSFQGAIGGESKPPHADRLRLTLTVSALYRASHITRAFHTWHAAYA